MTETSAPADPVVPPEFIDPEGDAELHDPRMIEETTTSDLRRLWAKWECRKGGGSYADPPFFGRKIGGVPSVAVDAYAALEAALRSSGYTPKSSWAYNCRKIAGSDSLSLHSYGVAIDLDPGQNPYSSGDKYSGAIKADHVAAVLAVRNASGDRVWAWGGNWSKPDRMHFQLDRGPDAVDVDWATVPGGQAVASRGSSPTPASPPAKASSAAGTGTVKGNVLKNDSEGKAVEFFQKKLLAWDPECLPEYGADGDYGKETLEAVKRFQAEMQLDPSGELDGVTAVLLAAQT
jgi:peptidoglycan hydrolase-like protein with peptidoglycan-binding domain